MRARAANRALHTVMMYKNDYPFNLPPPDYTSFYDYAFKLGVPAADVRPVYTFALVEMPYTVLNPEIRMVTTVTEFHADRHVCAVQMRADFENDAYAYMLHIFYRDSCILEYAEESSPNVSFEINALESIKHGFSNAFAGRVRLTLQRRRDIINMVAGHLRESPSRWLGIVPKV